MTIMSNHKSSSTRIRLHGEAISKLSTSFFVAGLLLVGANECHACLCHSRNSKVASFVGAPRLRLAPSTLGEKGVRTKACSLSQPAATVPFAAATFRPFFDFDQGNRTLEPAFAATVPMANSVEVCGTTSATSAFRGCRCSHSLFDQPPTQLLRLKLVETARELPILSQDGRPLREPPAASCWPTVEASNLRVISLIQDKP